MKYIVKMWCNDFQNLSVSTKYMDISGSYSGEYDLVNIVMYCNIVLCVTFYTSSNSDSFNLDIIQILHATEKK